MEENRLLQPVDDNLPMRPSGIWAKDKLRVLARYIATSTTALKDLPWRRRNYIDLQAGPGKNCVSDNDLCPDPPTDVFLGSPLIALTEGARFTHYYFVEQRHELFQALQTRCSSAPDNLSIRIIEQDCNQAVKTIADEIRYVDRPPYSQTNWNSLSLAFLDPEGLELNWETVETLAALKRTDLVINFSIGGLRRSAEHAWNVSPGDAQADRFFGTTVWREIPRNPDGSMPSWQWIEFYKSQLTKLGYKFWGTDVPIKIPQGVELYRLLFASKAELGAKLWEDARKNAPTQRSLF